MCTSSIALSGSCSLTGFSNTSTRSFLWETVESADDSPCEIGASGSSVFVLPSWDDIWSFLFSNPVEKILSHYSSSWAFRVANLRLILWFKRFWSLRRVFGSEIPDQSSSGHSLKRCRRHLEASRLSEDCWLNRVILAIPRMCYFDLELV